MTRASLFLIITILCGSIPAFANWEGLAIHGTPKYKSGFSHLSYANPDAPQGGELTLGWSGSFDTLNAYSAKGISPLLISGLVFQTLGQSTLDEPFSVYPELSQRFELAKDKLSMTIELHPDAKFSDGLPVTSEDVDFSFRLFRSDAVNAFYKSYWADIKEVKIISPKKFQFMFSKVNTELPAIAMQLTVFPKHIYSKGDFGKDFTDNAIGSGPYMVEKFKRGSFITYKKNPKFWAKADPFNKGKFNFEFITIKYYRDDTAQVEAFKKGDFDIYVCYSSQVWVSNLTGDRFDPKKWILKENWPHDNNEGSQGFFFNLRKPIFQNPEVRKAISLAFDFEWTNKTLFHGQYTENNSFFENSPMKAVDLPSPKEKEYLVKLSDKFKNQIPTDTFTTPMGGENKNLTFKKRLKIARKILKNSGFKVKNGVLTSEKDNLALKFKFLLRSQSMARVVEPFISNLKKIGIQVTIDMEEPSVYQRKLQNRDFDMVVLRIGQSQSPGNEQLDFWHSSQSEEPYSRNYYGLKNQAVDEVIEEIIRAKSREDLVFYTKILDRILYHSHIAVHNWHNTTHRVAMWNKYGKPKDFPKYYLPFSFLDFLWIDPAKNNALEKAVSKNQALSM